MEPIGSINLPGHLAQGGFDHAAVHAASSRLYVAHTCNDAIEVIDCETDDFLYSIPNLRGVAGALVSDERGLVFSSNRGEDSVGIFAVDEPEKVAKVKVGIRPNGLAFDPRRGLLLAANVGDAEIPGSHTLSVIEVENQRMVHSIQVAGRTRWTVFDPDSDCFYVNIANPSEIAVVRSAAPTQIMRSMKIPSRGPHGLDFDPATKRLFCACDEGKLFALAADSGEILLESGLSGTPDVIFFNARLKHLYVAVGDPGVIEVFETESLRRIETIPTEKGAHTLGFDATRNKVYAFLPQTCRAAVYLDE